MRFFHSKVHIEQIMYVIFLRRHSSPLTVVAFRASPILELKWNRVDEEEIHCF
jgi:hypothetical protein